LTTLWGVGSTARALFYNNIGEIPYYTLVMPAKNVRAVMTYLKPEIYEVLKQLAELEDRSVSNLVSRVLTDWVKEQNESSNN